LMRDHAWYMLILPAAGGYRLTSRVIMTLS
jgi:hypothetical protein